MRLNKFLAQAGVASRRGADALIERGAVSVNAQRATPGADVDPEVDVVTVSGKRVRAAAAEHITIAFNKPLGVVTTMRDERGRRSVGGLLKKTHATVRLLPIGRLDAASTGILLCTSDGELARILTHPSFEVEREYRVTVRGTPSTDAIRELSLRDARRMADGSFGFTMVLRGGKNREIRRACAQAGLRVVSLTRTRYGPIALGRLKAGSWRALASSEIQALEALRKAARTQTHDGSRHARGDNSD